MGRTAGKFDFLNLPWLGEFDLPPRHRHNRNADSQTTCWLDSALHFHFGQHWQGSAVNAIPSLVKHYRIVVRLANGGEVVAGGNANNHQCNRIDSRALTDVTGIRLECRSTYGLDRAQVYVIRMFRKSE